MLRKDPFITGEYYHIYNRGIDKREIFKSINDYERFIMLLYICNSNKEQSFRLDNLINQQHKSFEEIMVLDREKILVSIGAWCLMTNHFHILVRQEIDGGITKFMKKLGTAYSMYFNIKYVRTGSLFGGLFKAKLVGNNDNYLKQLLAYIHLNPLEKSFPDLENKKEIYDQDQMKNFLDLYRYSSYQDYLGIDRYEKGVLNRESFPEYFKTDELFVQFIEDYYLYKEGHN